MEFYSLNLTDNPFWYKERFSSLIVLAPSVNIYPVLVTTKRTLITITVLWIVSIVEGFLRNIIREIVGKDARALLELIDECLRSNLIPNERDLQPIIPLFLILMTVTVLLPSGIILISHAWIFMTSFTPIAWEENHSRESFKIIIFTLSRTHEWDTVFRPYAKSV